MQFAGCWLSFALFLLLSEPFQVMARNLWGERLTLSLDDKPQICRHPCGYIEQFLESNATCIYVPLHNGRPEFPTFLKRTKSWKMDDDFAGVVKGGHNVH